MTTPAKDLEFDYSKYGFRDEERYVYKSQKGLSPEVVKQISHMKGEPEWMLKRRLKALEIFQKKPLPLQGMWANPSLANLNFDEIYYYIRPDEKKSRSWDDVPESIRQTFEKLGIPEAERKFLAGVGAQYESEVVYHSLREEWEKLGVIFLDTDTGLKEYPELFKEYFGTVVPAADNKFAALNTAVWSGGSFIYVPKGVKVDIPLQAYFRINAENMGQFERTLIIVEEGAEVHYIEGCLPEGELVSLGDEMVPIESVAPGTLALNSDGYLAPVVSARRRSYRGDLVRIVPLSPGNAFELTPEHPVWALRRGRVARPRADRPATQWDIADARFTDAEPEWVPAGELEPGDLICFPVAVRSLDHPEISDDLLRFLGYYLAEGSAFRNGVSNAPTVSISLDSRDSTTIADVRALMTRLAGKPAGVYEVPAKHEARVYVYSAELLEIAQQYCGVGSATKRLHPHLMELPPERQRLLLETYLTGDGSRHTRSNGRTLVRAATVSRTLAFQLQEILARLGIYAGILVRKAGSESMPDGRVVRRCEQYVLHYEDGATVRRVRFDARRNCFWVPVRAVARRPYEGWVYNLEMASAPNAYLARGFAVHNCTAPIYSTNSLHSAVVEIIVKKGAKCRYTTIQNWANNIYNLVTKRAVAYEEATMEWIDGNIGSRLTMKYPSVYLMGRGARGEVLSVAYAGRGQHQDAGAKMIHAAPDTTSRITNKSVSKDGGRTTYRGLAKVQPGATNAKINVVCDALILDEQSASDTIPFIEVEEHDATLAHEATVGKIGEDQLFYLMSRGLSEAEALSMIVLGFMEPFTRELPMEYAVELNRLIHLEMEGSVG
ncbi:MAG: UPF0051 protein [Herpetosiphonaceae bacterium]|nr:MAG: UPF0051 protein [Herpetosiphonaceae bacterium]